MNWTGKRVLVTGGGGFIGSALVEELAHAGASLRVLLHYNSRNDWGNLELLDKSLRDSIEVILGDVQDPFAMRKAVMGRQVVFHLAALIGVPYSYVAPAAYVSTNVQGTMNVVQACLEEGVERVIHTSTSETYGTARYVPIDEGHPLQGQSPYSASKIGADKIAESYHLSFGLPLVTVRPFNTFGPRQSARAVIPTIISQALGRRKTIRLGSLDPVRDLTFVRDTTRGFMLAASAEAAIGDVVNLGAGKGITIGDLARKILDQIDPEIRIECDEARARPKNGEVMRLICNNEKASRLLDWEPRTSLDKGLAETIQFIREHPSLYKPEMYTI